jgi:xylulokinase
MCHPAHGGYAWLGCSFTGGESLRWLRGLLQTDYDALTAAAAAVEAGSEGLFFAPWLEGRATPGPDERARGLFTGLSLRHRRGHLARALMEGVAYELREALECYRRAGLPVDEIRIGEGGMRAPLWRQIVADVVGAPVRVIVVQDLSALGSALIAAVGTGVFSGFTEACDASVDLGDTVEPVAEACGVYEAGFARYRQLYPALQDWYRGDPQ